MAQRVCGCGRVACENTVEQRDFRRGRPELYNFRGEPGVRAANPYRSRILQHRGQLDGSLARIERHYDQSLGHHRQIKRSPANTVRRKQSAAVTLLESAPNEESARLLDKGKQFVTGHEDGLSIAYFAEHRHA